MGELSHIQRLQIEKHCPDGVVHYMQACLAYVFGQLPLADNYFWRVYLYGAYTPDCCPAYLRREHFQALRDRAKRGELSVSAEDAELIIEDRPVRVRCRQCGRDSDASANRLLCDHCGDWRTELLSGDELMLIQVEFMRERAYV